MIEFGKPIGFRNRFPPLLYKHLILTPTNITSLFSTPYTLFPATPNVGFVVERGWIYKEPGIAYTIGGAGNYSIVAGALNLLGPNAPTGFWDSASGRTVLWQGYGQNGVYPNMLLETQFANVAITLQQATANMTGGSGNTHICMEFRAYTLPVVMWD